MRWMGLALLIGLLAPGVALAVDQAAWRALEAGNLVEAERLIADDVILGDPSAQAVAGEIAFLQGEYGRSLKMFASSASQGHHQGYLGLGRLYENGQGVPKDRVQALIWYSLAGSHGNERAIWARRDLEAAMAPNEIAEVNDRARQSMMENYCP